MTIIQDVVKIVIKNFGKVMIKNYSEKDKLMSRSYKHIACCKDPNTKGMKRLANKTVRRTCFDIPSGNAYKKYFVLILFQITNFFETFYSYANGYKKIYICKTVYR